MKKILFALLLTGLVVFGFFAVRSAYQEIKRNRQIEAEIAALENEAENLSRNNQNLREKISYFETKEFQELEAKRELNFQKPDENVVIVKPSPSQVEEEDLTRNQEQVKPKVNYPNYIKWYNLFFN